MGKKELSVPGPFDPIVRDRERFARFRGWAIILRGRRTIHWTVRPYSPAANRVRGYDALPMLWRGRVIGWANASVPDGHLRLQPGYTTGRPPRDAAFKRALEEEHARLERFLRR